MLPMVLANKDGGRMGMTRYSVKDAEWREHVLAIWNHRCAMTGNPATDGHHIAGKQAWPQLRWEAANGIALTRERHRWAHDNPEAFKAWLRVSYPMIVLWIEEAKRRKA